MPMNWLVSSFIMMLVAVVVFLMYSMIFYKIMIKSEATKQYNLVWWW